MEKNPKRQRRTPGSILRIDLEDGYYCYAQILDEGVAFFDIHTKEKKLKDLNILLNTPVLFIIGVYTDVISQGIFLKVGKLPIRDDLKNQPMNYIEDILATDKNRRFELYNPSTGETTPCTQDQAWGLERCAVWNYNHIEDRLRDHYAGRTCKWLHDFWRNPQVEYRNGVPINEKFR